MERFDERPYVGKPQDAGRERDGQEYSHAAPALRLVRNASASAGASALRRLAGLKRDQRALAAAWRARRTAAGSLRGRGIQVFAVSVACHHIDAVDYVDIGPQFARAALGFGAAFFLAAHLAVRNILIPVVAPDKPRRRLDEIESSHFSPPPA